MRRASLSARSEVLARRSALAAAGTVRRRRKPGVVGLGVAWVAALVCFVVLLGSSAYQVTVLGTAFALAIASLGVGLELRALSQLSLGQGAFIALGGYTELILGSEHGWGFVPSMVVAVLIAIAVGALLGLAGSRLRTHYFILLTAAIQVLASACITGLTSLTGGAEGRSLPGSIDLWVGSISSIRGTAILTGVVAVIAAVAVDVLIRRPAGHRMIAVSRAAPAARASGISPVRQNVYGGCILGGLGALSGVLYAPLIGYLGPDEFALSLSIICVLVGVVSTRLSFAMAIVAAVVLEELTQGIASSGDWAGAIYGAIIVVVGAGMAAGQLARNRRS